MDRFKIFLVNEGRSYLGHKVNDILTSLQDTQEDMPNIGARHLNRVAEQIVDEIRKILHSSWDVSNQKHLKELQKIAVAIQKTIDEKGDLKEILPAATQATQMLASKLGVKVNNLEAPEAMGGEDVSPDDFQMTGTGPAQPQQGQQPEQPPQGQPPQQGQALPPPTDNPMLQPDMPAM